MPLGAFAGNSDESRGSRKDAKYAKINQGKNYNKTCCKLIFFLINKLIDFKYG
jgi:hypothetical protein